MTNKLFEFTNDRLDDIFLEDNQERMFESIYSSNYSSETTQDSAIEKYLESPLETGLNIPMYLKESENDMFQRIYEETKAADRTEKTTETNETFTKIYEECNNQLL
jgi:hypothetical protein